MYLKAVFSIVICFLAAALVQAKCSLSDNHSADWVVDMFQGTDCFASSNPKSKVHHYGDLSLDHYCSACYALPSPLKGRVDSIVYTANVGTYMVLQLYSSSDCTGHPLGERRGSKIWNSTPSGWYKTASFKVCLPGKS
ncbi:hypothetical protein BV22DRAFT_845689 [Leucogyrophana mollusca]|uniref:Uncharacterized protein n=1 Tax=Leucogyrophana mollusca TaxID=85980 RepID=A0ACB8B387_9AGAM|nr:hypothetical protein BV22DRAFT_845689 [Leucogyrophana mollusca]